MDWHVVNRHELGRYELVVDGQVAGVADYRIEGDRVVMPHTQIDPGRQGQGLAALLVGAALEDVRASGRSVVARCWYVAGFIDDHPEFGDLVAR